MDKVDIFALGEAMVEFNQTDPARRLYQQGFGGDTSNAIIAAARHGARTGYLSSVGKDMFGDMLLSLWRREGVDARHVTKSDCPTGAYFVTHGHAGHEFHFLRRHSAASAMQPESFDFSCLAGARFLHVSGISQAISVSACNTVQAAIQAARQHGVRVSYDPNLRLKLWSTDRALLEMNATLPTVDLFLPSLDDMKSLIGTDDPAAIIDWSLARGCTDVVLKLGNRGALVATQGERKLITGHPVQAVDTTGAGDCFAGSLLARLVAGDSLMQAANYANASAALSTLGYGAVEPIPRESEVAAFLSTSN
ncbi:MAG: sugar kinase [Rhodoferax sp.]